MLQSDDIERITGINLWSVISVIQSASSDLSPSPYLALQTTVLGPSTPSPAPLTLPVLTQSSLDFAVGSVLTARCPFFPPPCYVSNSPAEANKRVESRGRETAGRESCHRHVNRVLGMGSSGDPATRALAAPVTRPDGDSHPFVRL